LLVAVVERLVKLVMVAVALVVLAVIELRMD
jgi:hypothetical protein